MDIQRLRNLTTKRLHTSIGHVYKDIDTLTGAPGVMTHMLPNAMRAMTPWLKNRICDPRFWDNKHDPSHVGEIEIEPMTPTERAEFFRLFRESPSPLAGKDVIVIQAP